MSSRRLLALAQRLRVLQAQGGVAATSASRVGAAAAAACAPAPAAAAAAAAARAAAAAAGAAAAPLPRPPLPPHHHQQLRAAWTDSKGYTHFGERTPLAVVGFGAGGGGAGGGGSPHARLMAYAAAGTGASFAAYWWSCRETVPYTGRTHSVMFVSPRREVEMGRQTFDQMRREAAAQGALVPNAHPAARLVARVGRRVAAAASDGAGGGSSGHMRGLDWEFAVVDSPQVNAMVAPGGKVIVYTGLLRLIKGDEDELAAVLAHEAAHVLARHHAERMGRAYATAALNFAARYLFGVPVPGTLVALALLLPHSRANEREADAIGVRLAARACFDPAANVRMLQRLAERDGGGGGAGDRLALLRTHPLTGDRVEAVRALLPQAVGEYDARCGAARAALRMFADDRAAAAAVAAPGPLG